MSAKLLEKPGKMHELKDDLESFLHVLGWTTLHCLPVVDSYEASCRGEDMKMFNEHRVFAGGPDIGGRLKALMLCGGGYPSEDLQPRQPTPLLSFLRALSSPFASLYSLDPPDEASREEYRELQRRYSDDDLVYRTHAVRIYDQNIERLETSFWFMTSIEDALAHETWPADDKANPELPICFSLMTDGEEVQKMNRLHLTYGRWDRSKTLPVSSKCGGSPTPESGTKRRRGAPAASGSGI